MKKNKRLSLAVLHDNGLTIKDFLKVYNDFYARIERYEITDSKNELLPTSQIVLIAYDEKSYFKEYKSLIDKSVNERKDYFTSDREIASLIMSIVFLEKLYC